MSKCSICGRELLAGDAHWDDVHQDMGVCNRCWDFYFVTNRTDSSKNKCNVYIGDPYPCGVDLSGNKKKCPDCKDKDHRIAVLEKALELACEKITDDSGMGHMTWLKKGERETIRKDWFNMFYESFIKQAEKKLEENK